MASEGGVRFETTSQDHRNARLCVQEDIARAAQELASLAASNTPRLTGRMASSWTTAPGYSDPGTTVVTNTVPYARFVEYGTKSQPARAPLGRAMASGTTQ
jgi:hypothetical protein